MTDAEAATLLLELVAHRFPDAAVGAWAEALRALRRQGVLRRQEVRRQCAALLLRRLPPSERQATREALSWLLGDRWLPPSGQDLAKAVNPAGPHPVARPFDLT